MTDAITLPQLLVTSAHSQFRLRVCAAAWSEKHGTDDHNSGGLVLLSAVGPDTAAKAVRAILHSPDIAADIRLEEDYTVRHLTRATVDRKPVGYTAATSKLAPGAVHLVALARIPGLLPDAGDDQLWAELSSPRYTTPLLRPWVGWIKRYLVENGKIVLTDGYNATAGVLQVEQDDLDAVVSYGVRCGYLKMEA